jgi:uncharacterized membrane protein YebE (DUF533 family)
MMNISDLLGKVMQSGLSKSSGDRLRRSLSGGNDDTLRSLAGQSEKPAGGGGLMGSLAGMLGGGGGGSGGLLEGVMGDAGRAVGGKQNLAVGGLGALAGALMGGGGKSMSGALGGGVMALLGAMAFKALKSSGNRSPQVPLGLAEPQTESERQQLEQNAELVLRAMINAAKADGRIDEDEIRRIVGKLGEVGADAESQQFVMTQMQKPAETDALISAAKGQPELAAQIYGASLLAIEVDTPAEKDYLEHLAAGLALEPAVTQRIEELVGLRTEGN